MKLILKQFLETKTIKYQMYPSILVVVTGKDNINALHSLNNQIYTNFRIYCVHDEITYPNGEVELNQIKRFDLKDEIKKVLDQAKEEYIFLIEGQDSLLPNALLEYARYLNDNKEDIVYADECVGDVINEVIYDYQIKPEFDYIVGFQSLYTGKALIWKKTLLASVMSETLYSENFDIWIRELFQRCLFRQQCKVGNISLVLLIKASSQRDAKKEKQLQILLQKNIEKYTKWMGRIAKTNGYNPFAFQMINTDCEYSVEIIVIQEYLEKTKHLISQLKISFPDSRIIIGGKKENIDELKEFCGNRNINFMIVEQEDTYVHTLEKLSNEFRADIQILMSEQVRWMNFMSTDALLSCFNKPEVMIASPQIATEGDNPRLIYAGGEVNSLGLVSTLYKGREQRVQSDGDLAWLNHPVINLNKYCLALRKNIWKKIFPMSASICDSQQFTQELSYICCRKDIVCEYAAQSSFWVEQKIEKLYIKKKHEVQVEENLQQIRLTGNYWHWLCNYGDIIKAQAKKMQYVERTYLRYLNESFKVYGLEYIKECNRKRVLVFSHELSLTGAPLVLVQAVESLKKMKFDVLVVSPMDGPLKKTYLEMKVPVIIEPELYINYEYIRIAYDFDFVIACTVCLWPVIEALGNTNIPVLWWVHDSRMGYVNWLRYELPEKIGDNIHLYCGGEYAQNVILEYRPQYQSKILLYGLEDFSKTTAKNLKRRHWGLPEDKIIYANIGQIISRKGQDVLVAAIDKLSNELLQQCVFVFVGGIVDRRIYNKIMDLKKRYPDNICYIEQISHEDLKQFYREIDCVICSSVDDPLPAFVAEGLMMSRIVICSKNTAFDGIIDDGKNGYLFESGDVNKLYENIVKVIEQKNQMEEMKQQARALYEATFTNTIFEDNFRKVIKEMLQ